MKALSLTQPWASLVVLGAKQIETRSWSTPYRGPLAIHAAQRFPSGARAFANSLFSPELFGELLNGQGYYEPADLPRGDIVGMVTLITVSKIIYRANTVGPYLYPDWQHITDETELMIGDYREGRYGWEFDEPHDLPFPIRCRGALGLWDVPEEIMVQVARMLEAPHV